LYTQLHVNLFILHSVYCILYCLHTDQILLKLPASHTRLSKRDLQNGVMNFIRKEAEFQNLKGLEAE